MSVSVVLPSALREYAAEQSVLTVPESGASTVGEALTTAFAPWPLLGHRVLDERGQIRRHVNIFVDGIDVKPGLGLEHPVSPTSRVHVVAAVSGG